MIDVNDMEYADRLTQTEFGEEIGFSADDICSFETTRRDLSQVNLYANRQIENFFKGVKKRTHTKTVKK